MGPGTRMTTTVPRPYQVLGWTLCCPELQERAVVPVMQWQTAGKRDSPTGLWPVVNSGEGPLVGPTSGAQLVLEGLLWLTGMWETLRDHWQWGSGVRCHLTFPGAPHVFGVFTAWPQPSRYLQPQRQLARPCEEKNGSIRGRDGLKRRRKWQGDLKRKLEQQKNTAAVTCREDGKEEESQAANGRGAAVGRRGRQSGWRTWKTQSTISFCALCRDNSRSEYN